MARYFSILFFGSFVFLFFIFCFLSSKLILDFTGYATTTGTWSCGGGCEVSSIHIYIHHYYIALLRHIFIQKNKTYIFSETTYRYKPMKVDTGEREGTPANKWVTCTLAEGKNREIRRIFDHFQMPVSRIVRTKFGPYRCVCCFFNHSLSFFFFEL